MNSLPTVRVEALRGLDNVLRLFWETRIVEADVRPAFEALTSALDKAQHHTHVLVDLTCDPNIPLAATMQATIAGPFRHPKMGEWVVVGTNWRARMIADVIARVGPRDNIHWFDTEDQALVFLRKLSPQPE
jgi:hypothetical protein